MTLRVSLTDSAIFDAVLHARPRALDWIPNPDFRFTDDEVIRLVDRCKHRWGSTFIRLTEAENRSYVAGFLPWSRPIVSIPGSPEASLTTNGIS